MKRLQLLFIFIFIPILGCDLFFSAPFHSNYHHEIEPDLFSPEGYYISPFFQDGYGKTSYCYYFILGSSEIETYVLNESFDKILYGAKGSYDVECSQEDVYEGTILYDSIYDQVSESFTAVADISSDISIEEFSVMNDDTLHYSFLFSNFNDSYHHIVTIRAQIILDF